MIHDLPHAGDVVRRIVDEAAGGLPREPLHAALMRRRGGQRGE